MNVLFVGAEAAPYIKFGGLADVLGSLPKELVKQGVKCSVVLPKYSYMKFADTLEYVTSYYIRVPWRREYCGIFKTELDGVTFYFIDNEYYFSCPSVVEYEKDECFAYFNYAVLEMISHLKIKPDIISLHDWQSAMIAPLYKESYGNYESYRNIKIMFTIHNIADQGKVDPRLIEDLYGFYLSYYGNLRHDNCFNMMESAILYSDVVAVILLSKTNDILLYQYKKNILKSDFITTYVNKIMYYIDNKLDIFNQENYWHDAIGESEVLSLNWEKSAKQYMSLFTGLLKSLTIE